MNISSSDNRRLTELDSLRGLASFSVFLSHSIGMLSLSGVFLTLNHSFVRIFWDGAATVTLFFVLSGFVLALPYVTGTMKRLDVLPFLIRRFFRIYPAYLIAILFSLGFKFYIFKPKGLLGLSEWITSFWNRPDTSSMEILKHLIMIGLNTHEIDPVVWTLVIELKVSILFPIFIFLLQKINSYQKLIFSLIVLITLGYTVKSTFIYLPLFFLGGILAKYRRDITNFLNNRSKSIKIIIMIIGILLYDIRYTFFGLIKNETTINYLIGLGTFIIISQILASNNLRNVLLIKPFIVLGDISYSFYLLHFPILLTCTSLVYGKTHSIIMALIISLIFTLIFSLILFRVIELPFQKLGKKLSVFIIQKVSSYKQQETIENVS